MSSHDPLGLLVKPGKPSPKTARVIGRGLRISEEFRPAIKEPEDAGLLPGAKTVGSAPKYDSYRRIMPRPREWYYPKRHELRRELVWQAGPWEAQYDRGVPQPPLPGKQAKATPSPRSRLREDQIHPSVVIEEEGKVEF